MSPILQFEGRLFLIAKESLGLEFKVNDSELSELDRLEGYEKNGKNNLYNRVEQTVQIGNRSFQAFVYVHPNKNDMKRLKEIPDEDWCVYCYFNQK